jgi:thiamine-monophosphate kinase
MPSRTPPGELALIDHIRRRASGIGGSSSVRLGIGDDAAILRLRAGEEAVLTTDFSLETRHFTRDLHPPQSAGWRTLARGLSDLAAMGARPVAAFLSLALPRAVAQERTWLDGFLDGLLDLAKETDTPLAGGDTSEAPGAHVLADIVLLGAVPTGKALRRDRARPGDALYVTGALGGAAAELQQVLAGRAAHPSTRDARPHLYPQPRLKAGLALRRFATAAMDISDGLSTDLAHLCTGSHVRAEIQAAALPLHPLTRAHTPAEALHLALHGGEDYELLFTARPGTKIPRSLAGVPLTRIGTILSVQRRKPQVELLSATGVRTPLHPAGWEHLR